MQDGITELLLQSSLVEPPSSCLSPVSLSHCNSSARGGIFPAITLCKVSALHVSCVTSCDSCSPLHSWISPGTRGMPVEHNEPAIPTHSQQLHQPLPTAHREFSVMNLPPLQKDPPELDSPPRASLPAVDPNPCLALFMPFCRRATGNPTANLPSKHRD